MCYFSCPSAVWKEITYTHSFFSDDSEIHPARSPSPEVDEDLADLEETDSDEEEAGGFNEDAGGFEEKEGGFNKEGEVFDEKEVVQDSDFERRGKDSDVDGVVYKEGEKVGKEVAQDSDFERRGKDSDVDGAVYKEGENVGKEGKMRNSEDFGLQHVTNMQEEPSIIDSVSTLSGGRAGPGQGHFFWPLTLARGQAKIGSGQGRP